MVVYSVNEWVEKLEVTHDIILTLFSFFLLSYIDHPTS